MRGQKQLKCEKTEHTQYKDCNNLFLKSTYSIIRRQLIVWGSKCVLPNDCGQKSLHLHHYYLVFYLD